MTLSVSQVWVYPVKSCAGILLDRAVITDTGFLLDRNWMVTRPSGRFITQRQEPKMALVRPRVEPDGILQGSIELAEAREARLVLSAPGVPDLVVPLYPKAPRPLTGVSVWSWDGEGGDEGDEASAWLSSVIGIPGLRLVRYEGAGTDARGRREAAPDSSLRRPLEPGWADPGFETAFSDGYPFLVVSQASLEAVNEGVRARAIRRASEAEGAGEAGTAGEAEGASAAPPTPSDPARDPAPAPLPMNRFRPNIVVAGSEPWAEDGWGSLAVGGCTFELVKPCSRCRLTTVDQATATRDSRREPEPLATLAELRKGEALGFLEPRAMRKEVFFGWNATAERAAAAPRPGVVAVGDRADVLRARDGADVRPRAAPDGGEGARAHAAARRDSRPPPDVFSLRTLVVVLLMLLAGLVLANLSPRDGRRRLPTTARRDG